MDQTGSPGAFSDQEKIRGVGGGQAEAISPCMPESQSDSGSMHAGTKKSS